MKEAIERAFEEIAVVMESPKLTDMGSTAGQEALSRIRAHIEEQAGEIERLREAITSEPELPDNIPDEMWEAMRYDRDITTEAMRLAVQYTKQGIMERAKVTPSPEQDDLAAIRSALSEALGVDGAVVVLAKLAAKVIHMLAGNAPYKCVDCPGMATGCDGCAIKVAIDAAKGGE
jgi:hypothetical protein